MDLTRSGNTSVREPRPQILPDPRSGRPRRADCRNPQLTGFQLLPVTTGENNDQDGFSGQQPDRAAISPVSMALPVNVLLNECNADMRWKYRACSESSNESSHTSAIIFRN